MAISKTVNNGTTTVGFEYTADTQKVTDTLTDAAKYLYTHGVTAGIELEEEQTEDDLTNAQVGEICDFYVKKVLIDAAKTYNSTSAQDVARDTAEEEAENKYI